MDSKLTMLAASNVLPAIEDNQQKQKKKLMTDLSPFDVLKRGIQLRQDRLFI